MRDTKQEKKRNILTLANKQNNNDSLPFFIDVEQDEKAARKEDECGSSHELLSRSSAVCVCAPPRGRRVRVVVRARQIVVRQSLCLGGWVRNGDGESSLV